MTIKYLITILALFPALGLKAQETKPISRSEAIQLVKENNREIRISQQEYLESSFFFQDEKELTSENFKDQVMSYYFSKILPDSFEGAIDKVTKELKEEGFGILTEIDVRETFKKKLDVDFRKYRILGACNPQMAYKAISSESKIGTMLPCNVIVQELEDGKTEVSAVDPVASMSAIENPELGDIAQQVRTKLETVIQRLS